MEASFKPQGSFGMPENMKKSMESSRKNMVEAAQRAQAKVEGPQAPPPVPPPTTVEAAPVKPELAEPTQAEKEEQFLALKKAYEESLQTTITEDDVKDYIFKGRLTKEVNIITGVVKGTFQTLTPDEHMEIDARTAEYRENSKYTSEGVSNQSSLVRLSYLWLAANGKPLSASNDPKTREKFIRKMGTHLVDAASVKYNELDMLLKLALKEKDFVKK